MSSVSSGKLVPCNKDYMDYVIHEETLTPQLTSVVRKEKEKLYQILLFFHVV